MKDPVPEQRRATIRQISALSERGKAPFICLQQHQSLGLLSTKCCDLGQQNFGIRAQAGLHVGIFKVLGHKLTTVPGLFLRGSMQE